MSSTARGPRWRPTFIACSRLGRSCSSPPVVTTTTMVEAAEEGAAATATSMTLIAGVRGDEFYITMNCGAQAEARKQGVELDFQGPDSSTPRCRRRSSTRSRRRSPTRS